MDIKKFLAETKQEGRLDLTDSLFMITKKEAEATYKPADPSPFEYEDWLIYTVSEFMSFDDWSTLPDDFVLLVHDDIVLAGEAEGTAILEEFIETWADIKRFFFVLDEKEHDGWIEGPFKTLEDAVAQAAKDWGYLLFKEKQKRTITVTVFDCIADDGTYRPIEEWDPLYSPEMATPCNYTPLKVITL